MYNILEHYSISATGFLHPKGENATLSLMDELDCKEKENVLELGFGTGTSLVLFSSIYEKTIFFGLELNSFMFKKAKERINFCNSKNIKLYFNDSKTKLPFENNFFDKIYIESVLAIQEEDDLQTLIQELFRVLKPNGKLVLNEGIWNPDFPLENIKRMNIFCKSNFGIIQANEKYPYIDNWLMLFEKNDFKVSKIINLSFSQKNKQKNLNKTKRHTLSKLFTLKNTLVSKTKLTYIKKELKYKKAIKTISKEGSFLNSYLITLIKK